MPRALQNATGQCVRWTAAPPAHSPACPSCNSTTKGATGAGGGTAQYAYTPHQAKVTRLSYTCDKCEKKCTARNPAMLARADPASPHVTEPDDCRPTKARAPAQAPAARHPQARCSPRLAALAPDAGGRSAADAQMSDAGAVRQPPPPPRPTRYRDGTDQGPCLADAMLGYHNVNGLGAPGAGKAYLRDVALRLSDVHAISETSWNKGQVRALKETMEESGHRLWAISAETRNVAKSGTAILVSSAIPESQGDGHIWGKPDGKAMAVALTIGVHPLYLLAAHLPHTDTERIAFLEEVADGMEQATASHKQTPAGAPWAKATYLWAGDLNLTANPSLDNEKRHSAPTPEVAAALDRLAQVMSGATDVYRALYPQGREYTHGSVEKKGSRRRLDVWFAPPAALLGPCGVVSARRVDREAAAFSYVNAHSGKERSKESDHDCVQITLRGTSIPKPKARTTLTQATLRHPDVRATMREIIEAAGEPDPENADALWCKVLAAGLAHQRQKAVSHGRKRTETLKRIRRLQEKVRGMAPGTPRNRAVQTLQRSKRKLQQQNHRDRRERDSQSQYDAQMAATGQGNMAKPWSPQQLVTRVQEPATCAVRAKASVAPGGRVQLNLTKETIAGAVHTPAYRLTGRACLNDVHTPSPQAERDR